MVSIQILYAYINVPYVSKVRKVKFKLFGLKMYTSYQKQHFATKSLSALAKQNNFLNFSHLNPSNFKS